MLRFILRIRVGQKSTFVKYHLPWGPIFFLIGPLTTQKKCQVDTTTSSGPTPASKFRMLSLWRIFDLRGSIRSEYENTVLNIFLGQILIEYNKRKISSEFERFLTSGLLTAEGQKSQENAKIVHFCDF